MSYCLLNSFFPNLVKINGFWSYKNIFKQFEPKKMCKKNFPHWRKSKIGTPNFFVLSKFFCRGHFFIIFTYR